MEATPRPQIAIFDTAVSSRNLGDEIIMDSVRRELRKTLPTAFFVNVATHDCIGPHGKSLIEESRLSVVGGTNLLTSDFLSYNQWRITWRDAIWLKSAVLLGVGWWQYQQPPTRFTSALLRRVLHGSALHSVRDGYTLDQLNAAGVKGGINTSCVTMWALESGLQAEVPKSRGASVVTTITDYKPDPINDRAFMDTLLRKYDKVYLWLQGTGDYRYVREQIQSQVEIVDPQLAAYDELLSSSLDLDYVGTRLHAGIRALTHKRRSLILSVDNRAEEIGRDTGLPVHPRKEPDAIARLIEAEAPLQMHLPMEEISRWRTSLRSLAGYGEG